MIWRLLSGRLGSTFGFELPITAAGDMIGLDGNGE